MGPLRIAKELINNRDPKVKLRANFWGRIASIGRPTAVQSRTDELSVGIETTGDDV
jgi:hypothetical protein